MAGCWKEAVVVKKILVIVFSVLCFVFVADMMMVLFLVPDIQWDEQGGTYVFVALMSLGALIVIAVLYGCFAAQEQR